MHRRFDGTVSNVARRSSLVSPIKAIFARLLEMIGCFLWRREGVFRLECSGARAFVPRYATWSNTVWSTSARRRLLVTFGGER